MIFINSKCLPVESLRINSALFHFAQLHVGVEAIRCTEMLFQPSLVGCPEAGLAELIEFVLRQFDAAEQQQLAENIFMTGGCAQFPGECRLFFLQFSV